MGRCPDWKCESALDDHYAGSREEETITRLSRVGFDQTLGYLKGGIEAWKSSGKEYDMISGVNAKDLEKLVKQEKVPVFDVRKENEYLSGHISSAQNTPLDFLNDYLDLFPKKIRFISIVLVAIEALSLPPSLRKGGFTILLMFKVVLKNKRN